MKRDMDLVRKILFKIEEFEHDRIPNQFSVEGYSEDLVDYHCYILLQAGLIEGYETTVTTPPGNRAAPTGLTWAGHDFLDAARDEGLWKKARPAIGNLAFEAVKSVMISLGVAAAKQQLGLP